jgi:hypothetical protein
MFLNGEGCAKDWSQAAIWGAEAGSLAFWDVMKQVPFGLDVGRPLNLGCDVNQICYALGWGLYWYQHGRERGYEIWCSDGRCLDYYCSCVELQQKSIFTFLWFWNRTTGVKEPGQMIARMVWEQRENNLVEKFDLRKEVKVPETKRIKK